MRIIITLIAFLSLAFASADKAIDNMNTNINELDKLYSEQNIKNNAILALDKDKALSFTSLIFLLTKHNELIMNILKIKGQ
ncbi:hypothetical protein CHLV4142_09175 [Campylobacter helveticus]|uniref:Uncharacterized protein n=2 Tax=Campylobacter helveticus TaxID=28898 RepID=A0ABY3L430_9BACT|nr:hypothetical protein [Campylobacter helveticus]ELU1350299.1 hypothetical protein [Campylobacter jejuni]MCR2040312.1 hypothetical protein [Campylobacter helveticus]MCR2060795.1 hypothetical protein [Campylobacter helveticus]MCR2066773.1 hypothetical protein [Campylobacter helveticus]QBL12739.1 hypothetical protein A0073_09940 [Campylobacter helveticus]